MSEKKKKAQAKKSNKKLLGTIAAYLSQCWEQAKLPQDPSDQKNFEKAAIMIAAFMDDYRIEENEMKFIGEKFFPTVVRVAKIQPADEVSTQLLLTMGPDILNSVL